MRRLFFVILLAVVTACGSGGESPQWVRSGASLPTGTAPVRPPSLPPTPPPDTVTSTTVLAAASTSPTTVRSRALGTEGRVKEVVVTSTTQPAPPPAPVTTTTHYHPPTTAPASQPTGEPWDRIAHCEASCCGLWQANTGNGYYGGLQMNMTFWRTYDGDQIASRPDLTSREVQITVARRARDGYAGHAARGYTPWPKCGRRYR